MKNLLLDRYKKLSLLKRFFIGSMILLPLFIVANGTLLLNAHYHSQLAAEEEKLRAQLYLLLSVTDIDNDQPFLPDTLNEPRLNQTHSGLYGFISNASHQELWRSASAELLSKSWLDKQFISTSSNTNNSPPKFSLNQRRFLVVSDENSNVFNTLYYDTEWVNEAEKTLNLRFTIVSDASAINADIQRYRIKLWQWLGMMSGGLLLAQLLIMRWGLQPLRRLSKQLQQLNNHAINKLDSDYPKEIQPVIDDLNTILDSEKQRRERYKNTMEDLAHSIKTPLAVIRSQLSVNNHSHNIDEYIDRIDQIVSHQLQRARISSRDKKLSITNTYKNISVFECTTRLINTLKKVYREKNIQFHNHASPESYFLGEEADLLEILGNILDNACKHGNDTVMINTHETNEQLTIIISDNGKGIHEKDHQAILERGARVDTAAVGQGLGLSVSVDIISSYNGELTVSNKNSANEPTFSLNGAHFSIVFNKH